MSDTLKPCPVEKLMLDSFYNVHLAPLCKRCPNRRAVDGIPAALKTLGITPRILVDRIIADHERGLDPVGHLAFVEKIAAPDLEALAQKIESDIDEVNKDQWTITNTMAKHRAAAIVREWGKAK